MHLITVKVFVFKYFFKLGTNHAFYFKKEEQMYLNKIEGLSATFENPFVCVPQELDNVDDNGHSRRQHIIFSDFGKINEKPKINSKA